MLCFNQHLLGANELNHHNWYFQMIPTIPAAFLVTWINFNPSMDK